MRCRFGVRSVVPAFFLRDRGAVGSGAHGANDQPAAVRDFRQPAEWRPPPDRGHLGVQTQQHVPSDGGRPNEIWHSHEVRQMEDLAASAPSGPAPLLGGAPPTRLRSSRHGRGVPSGGWLRVLVGVGPRLLSRSPEQPRPVLARRPPPWTEPVPAGRHITRNGDRGDEDTQGCRIGQRG
ncbi:MAG: hypothetical protein M1826_004021 [Phylliscum demangeonii]|nr:MAG: hypothetical protein M1826_004021 [Phylliscum demangeonii]